MRFLLLRATLVLTFSAVAFPQTVVESARIQKLLRDIDAQAREELRCEVIPIKPALNFSFRFQAGFIVHVPMKQ